MHVHPVNEKQKEYIFISWLFLKRHMTEHFVVDIDYGPSEKLSKEFFFSKNKKSNSLDPLKNNLLVFELKSFLHFHCIFFTLSLFFSLTKNSLCRKCVQLPKFISMIKSNFGEENVNFSTGNIGRLAYLCVIKRFTSLGLKTIF